MKNNVYFRIANLNTFLFFYYIQSQIPLFDQKNRF